MTIQERFMSFVDKKNDCWVWTGAFGFKHYGRFSYRGKNCYSHRVSYLIFKGDFPKEACVLHRCDNPPCVNPDHLFLGTRDNNAKDMVCKGRARNGSHTINNEKHPMVKLTNRQIEQVRDQYKYRNQYELADKFNISQSYVSEIISFKKRKVIV